MLSSTPLSPWTCLGLLARALLEGWAQGCRLGLQLRVWDWGGSWRPAWLPQPCHSGAEDGGLLQLLSGPPWLSCQSPGLAAQQRPCHQSQAHGRGHAPSGPGCNGALVFISCSLARTPQMSGVARLFPYPSSSLHGRFQPGLALSPLGREEGSSRARAPPQLRTTRPSLVNGIPGRLQGECLPGPGAQACASNHWLTARGLPGELSY